jgi:tripartite-type tricarboxylate transporter receptor subunit TctC
MHRRQFITLATGVASLPLLSRIAPAQNYPSRTITVVVPFAAGGPTDVVARIVGEHMSRTLGRQIVIENVVGAGGTTASTRVMRAQPDGYTLEMGHMGTHAASVALYPNLAYKPDVDFEPIGVAAGTPIVILARKDFPPKELKEFADHVKANEAKLNLAHAGVGSVAHVTGALLNSLIGVKPTQVPFNGTGPAMNALVGGQVDYMCDQIPNVVSQVQGGTVKAYAIATAQRNPALPNLPTTKEAGMPEFEVSAWNALFAPKGTARAILDKLSDALDRALSDDRTRARLLELGSDIPDAPRRGQEALRSLVKREIERWNSVLKST